MKKQYEVLQWAFSFLKKYDCEKNVANIYLQHLLDLDQGQFLINMREQVDDQIVNQFKEGIKKHIETGEPIQHLIGYTYFYGRKFSVNQDVLIPRFDTEILLEQTIKAIKQHFSTEEEIIIVDIGTGSGVIATSLALELSNAKVYATDISEKALKIAKENMTNLRANVQFFLGNFLDPLLQSKLSPHVIVSNPPYIRTVDKSSLSRTVSSFDPSLALYGGEDGLFAYEEILQQITMLPKSKKQLILFEIGFDQANDVTSIIQSKFHNTPVKVFQDLTGKDRVIFFEKS